MTTLVFLLEEPSAKALLEGLVPRLLRGGVDVRYLVFEGKQDLERQIARKLRGWRVAESRFVMRDQKIDGARRVGPLLDPEMNARSHEQPLMHPPTSSRNNASKNDLPSPPVLSYRKRVWPLTTIGHGPAVSFSRSLRAAP